MSFGCRDAGDSPELGIDVLSWLRPHALTLAVARTAVVATIAPNIRKCVALTPHLRSMGLLHSFACTL